MRISDWSSDVCSSDLLAHHPRPIGMVPVMPLLRPTIFEADRIILSRDLGDHLLEPIDREVEVEIVHLAGEEMQLPAKLRSERRPIIARIARQEIGRASWRERVCQDV